MKKYQKRDVPFVIYFFVLMVILASKTVFFGIIHMKEMILCTLGVLFFYNIYITKNAKLRMNKKLLIRFANFAILLGIVSLFYIADVFLAFKSYVGAILLFLEVLAIGILVVNSISKSDFVKAYVRIMVVISIISLVYYFGSIIDRNAILNLCNIYQSGNSRYIAVPWYTYGWQTVKDNGYVYNYIFGRNAGPFWEPGAFQGFLIIALFLLLSFKEMFKRKKLILSILLVTIFTTQSTTAYLVLLCSLIGYGKDYVECFFGGTKLSKKSKSLQGIVYVASFLFAVCVAYIILSSGNISNKFNATDGSFGDRMSDIIGTLEVLMYNPLAGVGMGATGNMLRQSITNTTTATTLLTLAMYYGIPFTIYYFYCFIQGCRKVYRVDSILKFIVILISFTLILMSETLYLLPIYAIFLFSNIRWDGRSEEKSDS